MTLAVAMYLAVYPCDGKTPSVLRRKGLGCGVGFCVGFGDGCGSGNPDGCGWGDGNWGEVCPFYELVLKGCSPPPF